MKQHKFNLHLILGLVFSASILTACNGTTNSSGSQVTSAIIPTLSGLAYDPVVKAVFSVNSQGMLCQLPVKNIPGNLDCNIVPPDNIVISSQVVSDNQGNIYAIGSQPASTDNFVLKYQTSSNTWSRTNIDIPFVLSFGKLLYRQGNLYLADPNLSTLYTINLNTNILESSAEFFTPGPAVLEDFDQNGNLFYTYQTNNVQPDFSVVSQTGVYTLPIAGSKAAGTQFGESNVYINDLVYVKNTAYACAESDFLYLASGSNANSSWQVLTNSSQAGYFSCDYITTDGSNLYYVEGQWTSDETFNNNYVNMMAIN